MNVSYIPEYIFYKVRSQRAKNVLDLEYRIVRKQEIIYLRYC